MKSKRLAALLVLEEDVVLMSFFQKLIYFRSQCCHWLQLHHCADSFLSEVCAVNPSSIFFSFTSLFSSSEIGSFFVRRPPASAQQKKSFPTFIFAGTLSLFISAGTQTVKDSDRGQTEGLPPGCPRALRDGVTASRRKAALGIPLVHTIWIHDYRITLFR